MLGAVRISGGKSAFPHLRMLSALTRQGHADGRCILDVLLILGALRNDLMLRSCRSVLCNKASQKVVRCVNPVQYQNAHAAPRSESQ
jgi:hypothetical protein